MDKTKGGFVVSHAYGDAPHQAGRAACRSQPAAGGCAGTVRSALLLRLEVWETVGRESESELPPSSYRQAWKPEAQTLTPHSR